MRRCLKLCSRAVLTALLITSVYGSGNAHADLFQQMTKNVTQAGNSAFYGSGGYIYQNIVTKPKKKLNLGYSVGKTSTCGNFDISKGMLKSFARSAVNGFLRGSGVNVPTSGSLTGMVAHSPMLLMSYASPTLANTFMHVKTDAEKMLNIRQKQCQSIQQIASQSMGLLSSAYIKTEYKCIINAQKNGESIGQALDECAQNDGWAKVTPLTASNDSDMQSNVNLTQEVESLTNMNDDEKTIFRSVEGNVAISDGKIIDQESSNPVEELYNKDVEDYSNKLQKVVNSAGLASTGSGYIDEDTLKKIYQETGVLITPTLITDLYNMQQADPYKAGIYEQMLASKLALYKVNGEILNVENDIAIAKQKANAQGNKSLVKLLDKKEKLNLEKQALINKEKAAEAASQMALRIHNQRMLEEYNSAYNSQLNGDTGNINMATTESASPPAQIPSADNIGKWKTYIQKVPQIPSNSAGNTNENGYTPIIKGINTANTDTEE